MKNKFMCLALLSILFLTVTGCGAQKKTLTCTTTASGVDVTFKTGFKGEKIDTMTLDYDLDLHEYSDEQVKAVSEKDICATVKKSLSQYAKAFSDCKQTMKNKKLKIHSTINTKKLSKTLTSKMTSVEKAKKQFEKENYKCSIN